MALGWLTLLKSVPWAGVIASAPIVADGAKQLWKAVSRPSAADEPPPPMPPAAGATPDPDAALEALAARVAVVEAGHHDLHAQMLKSTELIKALADQNALLVERVEAQRVRGQRLTALTVIALVVAGVALALAVAG